MRNQTKFKSPAHGIFASRRHACNTVSRALATYPGPGVYIEHTTRTYGGNKHMKKFLVLLLAGLLISAAGLSGCNKDSKDAKDKPAATDKEDAKEAKADKAADKAPADKKKDKAREKTAKGGGDTAGIKDFGARFCDAIQNDPNSFSTFLAIRPLMRIGLELEFAKDPETKKQMDAMGMDMEALVDMGIEQSGIESMEFPMIKDVGACDLSSAETLDCSELAANLATKGMMGEDLVPEDVTQIALDAYDITECGSLALEGSDGIINLGLLNVDGEWKMITLWD
jgi:hypothetical protein